MLQHNLVAYTSQPVPHPGRVELAAMFFYRETFVRDAINLGITYIYIYNLMYLFEYYYYLVS